MEAITDFQNTVDLTQTFNCVYIDFYLVCDKILIRLMVKKCQNYGVRCRTLAWITEFPIDKSQNFTVCVALSEECIVWAESPMVVAWY